jgi:hypothetical protein
VATPTPEPEPTPGPKVNKRYAIELSNRSITSPDKRDQIWQLLKELAKTLDPANPQNPDHQLIDLKLTLTTLDGHQGGIADKARQIGAKVTEELDDF